jgi:hypothetical protein
LQQGLDGTTDDDDGPLQTRLPADGSKFKLSVAGYEALDMIKVNLEVLITDLPRTDVENPDVSLLELKGRAHSFLADVITWLAKNPESPLDLRTTRAPAPAQASAPAPVGSSLDATGR